MADLNPSKAAVATAITLQELTTAPRQAHSADIDVSTAIAATFFARIGRTETTAFTLPAIIRIEGSPSTSGDADWQAIASLVSGTAAAESENMTATEPIGETVLAVASTTNLAYPDVVFIEHTTFGNSEFRRINKITTNTSVEIEDGLANEQTNASVIKDQADIFPPLVLDMLESGAKRLRVVVDGAGAAVNFAVEVKYVLTTKVVIA